MFWIICAAMVAVVVVSILAPFLRQRGKTAEPAAAYDLRVYRDQLREVERDLDRGVIAAPEAERLRVEIGRKVLEADRALAAGATAGKGPGRALPLIALAATVAGALAVYHQLGAPSLRDAPIAARLAAAERHYAARPSQAEAEAKAVLPPALAADPQDVKLVEQLREAVAKTPDEPQGLRFLMRYEAALGDLAAAQKAGAHLLQVQGDQASAQDHARMAELMVTAAGGIVTAEAEGHIVTALEKDRNQPEARYLLGLLQIQNGRPDRAFPLWARLLAEGPETAPWIAPIRANILELAWLAGEPGYQPPAPQSASLPGPDADAMAAANDMSDADRQQMIAGMVERLENRLATQGGSPEEWARLISALVVVDRRTDAMAVWQEAQARFAASPQALGLVNDAAQNAGLGARRDTDGGQ